MPATMQSKPVMSSELWLLRVLKRVAISTKVPIIISNMPIKGVNFFIKTLILLQIYEIFHFSLFLFHFFLYLCTRILRKNIFLIN
jgi:hypothetical protein